MEEDQEPSTVIMATVTSTSPTYVTDKPLERNESLAKIEMLVSTLIIVFALFGNSVVIYAIWNKRKNLSRMHFFIFHLCVADLLSAFLSQFPQLLDDILFHFYGPNFLCKIVKFFAVFPMYLSTFILTLTAFDRYLAICHPLLGFRGNQTFRMRVMVLSAWCLAAILAVPQLFLFEKIYLHNIRSNQCFSLRLASSREAEKIYVTFFALTVLILPSILMTIIYGMICMTVWTRMGTASGEARHPKSNNHTSWDDEDFENTSGDGLQLKTSLNGNKNRKLNGKQGQLYRSHTAASRVSRAKVKTLKMTITIVSVYILCWLPFFISQLTNVWFQSEIFPSWLVIIAMLMGNLNTCTNPWIYLSFSGTLSHVGCCKRPKRTSQPQQAGTPAEDNSTTSRYISFPTGVRTTSMTTANNDKDYHKIEHCNANG